jgi:2-(1,2-epoxy-1,2-dihydrophenyl)acetyl-CoA isomerase
VSDHDLEVKVLVELHDDGVAVVTRNAPPNNYLDVPTLRLLATNLEELDNDEGCRVTVLRSEGKHFCAGANLASPPREKSPDKVVGASSGPNIGELYAEALRLFRLRKPIVAAMQGSSIGGGLGLGLACDFRVATPESRFSANFALLGFHQGFGLSETLPAVVGQQRAWEMLYSAKRLDGDDAYSIGLCDRLVGDDELDASAYEFALELASAAPLAERAIRATMRGDLAERVERALVREAREQRALAKTADFREGIRATAERRPPNFTGS